MIIFLKTLKASLYHVLIDKIPQYLYHDKLKIIMLPVECRRRYIYKTCIKFLQGIGSLIRCETDKGRAVILDSRFERMRFLE